MKCIVGNYFVAVGPAVRRALTPELPFHGAFIAMAMELGFEGVKLRPQLGYWDGEAIYRMIQSLLVAETVCSILL